MRAVIPSEQEVGKEERCKGKQGRLQPSLREPRHFLLELLFAEPWVRHVLLHVVMMLVVLIVALRPGPEGNKERGVA